jgi:anti-anti-sigma factor
MSAESRPSSSAGPLDTAELGLLRARQSARSDRRLEAWIASQLDIESATTARSEWDGWIENLPALRRGLSSGGPERGGEGPARGWARFSLAYRRGIAVVRLSDRVLIQRLHLEELEADLMDLIEAGNHRLVLNFSVVERLGSWIVGVVGNAHRRCAAADGGQLKLCGLDAQLAEVFAIVGMTRELTLEPDEAAAIQGAWPQAARPRELPLDLLAAVAAAELPPICGGAPAKGAAVDPREPTPASVPRPELPLQSAAIAAGPRLLLEEESGATRLIAVSGLPCCIGREAGCQIQLGSPHISKRHALITHRGERLFLRDLGSRNGTYVDGIRLGGEEVELRHGLRFRLATTWVTVVLAEGVDSVESLVGQWIEGETEAGGPAQSETQLEAPPDALEPEAAERGIRIETIQDVVVVVPLAAELVSETANESLRQTLLELLEQAVPRRVVVNLEFVGRICRQTVALLLAHHFKLQRNGGGLRLCQAHPRILALLEQVRLTMLVDSFPTLDEAVLASWEPPDGGEPATDGS